MRIFLQMHAHFLRGIIVHLQGFNEEKILHLDTAGVSISTHSGASYLQETGSWNDGCATFRPVLIENPVGLRAILARVHDLVLGVDHTALQQRMIRRLLLLGWVFERASRHPHFLPDPPIDRDNVGLTARETDSAQRR